MPDHTPGPLSCEDGEILKFDADGGILLATFRCPTSRYPKERRDADGRLFAAAPEMYAILKSVEWEGTFEDAVDLCPCCRHCRGEGNGSRGHHPDCELAAVLARVEGTDVAAP